MKENKPFIVIYSCFFVLLSIMVSSCSNQNFPDISIVKPLSGETIFLYEETQIHSQIHSEKDWSRIELLINGELIRFDPSPKEVEDTYEIHQPWIPTVEGPSLISVILIDLKGKQLAKAEIAVLVSSMPSITATTTSTPTETPLPQPTNEGCAPSAILIEDINIPPGTVLKPGISFTKKWLVENSGNCGWKNYRLVFIRGNLLGGTSPFPLADVEANKPVEISLDLLAPKFPGTYDGTWRIQSSDGELFGPELTYRIQIPFPTPTRTNTPSPTKTPTHTATLTSTSTVTSTKTPTPTFTYTFTPTWTLTQTPTPTPSYTSTCTQTSAPTETPSPTETLSPTPTQTATLAE